MKSPENSKKMKECVCERERVENKTKEEIGGRGRHSKTQRARGNERENV